jgi:hypothetical protein
VLNQIDAADRAADVLVEGLSDTQFHWQPNDGRSWSIGQCLEHIGNINDLYGFIPAHDRRHLWQADQVKKVAGFPRS